MAWLNEDRERALEIASRVAVRRLFRFKPDFVRGQTIAYECGGDAPEGGVFCILGKGQVWLTVREDPQIGFRVVMATVPLN
jgi:hypothetical protein